MRIRKLIWILVGCCLLSGCRSGNANLNEKNVSDTEVTEESAESRKETEQDFPQRIQEDVSENVHMGINLGSTVVIVFPEPETGS